MRHQEFVDVGMASSLPTFKNRLVRIAEAMNFGHVSALLVLDQGAEEPIFLGVGNTPTEYLDSYQSPHNYKRDPVLQKLRNSSAPFMYDQDLYVKAGVGELWESQARFGFKTGIAVALHLPMNRHFVLGVDRAAPLTSDDEEFTQLMAHLQLLAVHAQDAAQRLMTRSAPEDEKTRLTGREREILRMTMTGMTVAAIATKLRVSEPTVQFHLVNVRKKFKTTSKHQAVLHALQMGLL